MTREKRLVFLARELATKDAATFADEFPGEVCDTAKTDWDAVAWTDAATRGLSLDIGSLTLYCSECGEDVTREDLERVKGEVTRLLRLLDAADAI